MTELLSAFSNNQTLLVWGLGLIVFLILLLILFALAPPPNALEERRKEIGLDLVHAADKEQSLVRVVEDTAWNRFSAAFLPRGETAKHFDQDRLTKAGYRSMAALATYHATRTGTMVALPILTVFIGVAVFGKTLQQMYVFMAAAFIVGMVLPSYLLDRKIEGRLTRLRHALPDALDLLVVCAESGLGINAALMRVGQELRLVHPEFASELAIANSEIRAGLERETALHNMVARSGLDDLKMLVMMLIQTSRLGTSLAETLRIYAEESREQRMQAAEEQAAKLSTKIIFPLVFCFMPAFFIVSVGPAFISALKAFK
ncbi:MAG: hypothetical protein RLZZ09_1735 [Pseudomonadota bacterium]|jgi:tight adherence protein C